MWCYVITRLIPSQLYFVCMTVWKGMWARQPCECIGGGGTCCTGSLYVCVMYHDIYLSEYCTSVCVSDHMSSQQCVTEYYTSCLVLRWLDNCVPLLIVSMLGYNMPGGTQPWHSFITFHLYEAIKIDMPVHMVMCLWKDWDQLFKSKS